MAFKIGVRQDKENSVLRKMFYDPETLLQLLPDEEFEHPVLENGDKAPVIDWYLRLLKGRDQKKINNEMVDMDTKRGSAKMKTGTATETRIIGSVVHVDGLEWGNGTPVEVISERSFADLFAWQINQVAKWIDELNGDSDEEKAAAKGE